MEAIHKGMPDFSDAVLTTGRLVATDKLSKIKDVQELRKKVSNLNNVNHYNFLLSWTYYKACTLLAVHEIHMFLISNYIYS